MRFLGLGIGADVGHALIRGHAVAPASAHGSNEFKSALGGNSDPPVYAYSACMSEERIRRLSLAERPWLPCIHEKGHANHRPLAEEQRQANREHSRLRVRMKRIFGAQRQTAGKTLLRRIRLARAKIKIGLWNFAYKHDSLRNLDDEEWGHCLPMGAWRLPDRVFFAVRDEKLEICQDLRRKTTLARCREPVA